MRVLIGIVAMIIWVVFISAVLKELNIMPSLDARFLSMAIVFAGAMAGGDGGD